MTSLTALAEQSKEHQFRIINRNKFATALTQLTPGKYTIEVKKVYRKRSNAQNRYKFGVAYKIIQECITDSTSEYWTIEEVHEYCKENFLPKDYVEQLKEAYNELEGEFKKPFRLTTTKLTTVKEGEYWDNMALFVAEIFGVEIPLPNE